jgi:hypothetical protein
VVYRILLCSAPVITGGYEDDRVKQARLSVPRSPRKKKFGRAIAWGAFENPTCGLAKFSMANPLALVKLHPEQS